MIKEKTITEIGLNLDNSYAHLPKSFFSMCNPIPVASPKLVCLNYDLANKLGLNGKKLKSKEGIEILAGNRIPEGASPLAQAYAGHQYGHFTMLGDGRAVLLGEQITPQGERFDIQLKGSGETPYSRRGDGRATLGPMLREYIISEAMHALGIPTTRSLAVVTTGESVIRQNPLPGAVLTRVASSHLRFGTFQYVANWGTVEELKILADYAIKRHFPDVEDSENPYLSLLQEVMKRQASLVTKWQMVGFIHGVMNTDNMTISGETIDYGPCAFMDNYDPLRVFSSIDTGGRYAYGNQHNIAGWNMARFAETLIPLFHPSQEEAIKLAENAISEFAELYRNNWLKSMRSKLGIFNEEVDDTAIIQELFNMMNKYSADYTNTFRALTFDKPEDTVLFGMPEFSQWYEKWQARLGRQEESKELSYEMMKNSNPAVIPRNHRVEAALEAAVKNGDYSVMERLLDVLASPYDYSKEQDEYTKLPEIVDPYYRTFCGT